MAYGQTPLVKGSMFRIVQDAIIDEFIFQYNPFQYQETLKTDWAFTTAPGQYLPVAAFTRFSPSNLKFQLFMYGRERNVQFSTGNIDLRKEIARLKLFGSPGPEFGIDNPQFVSPGRAKLVLGERVWSGVVGSIVINYEMFDRDYNPTMARADLSLTVTSFGFEAELAHLDAIRARSGLDG